MGGVNFSDVKSDQSGSRTVSRDLKFTYIRHGECGRTEGERRSDTSTANQQGNPGGVVSSDRARAEVGHIDREATRSTNWIAKVIPRSTTDKAIQEESSQVTLGERGSDTSTARSTNGIAKVIPRSTTNKAIQEESSKVTFHSGSSLNCSTARTNIGW